MAKHPQANGAMRLWIDIECEPADTVIQANGQILNAHINDRVITAAIPAGLFQQAGEISLQMSAESAAETLDIGILTVNPAH